MTIHEEERKPKKSHNPPQSNMPHVHTYLIEVDVADGHQHIILGVSGPARERGRSHCHRIHGRTSFISDTEGCGHWHTQDVMTGPAIEMPEGNHVHYFEGVTSKDDGHCHCFSGTTGLGPSRCSYENDEDDCYDDDDDDDCAMPGKPMPKYKPKHGKRPDGE